MKKRLFFLFALICSLSLFTACHDDDEKIQAEDIAGVYLGKLNIALKGANVGKDIPQKVYIAKVAEDAVSLELKDFSFGIPLGTIKVERCALIKSGDSYKFTGTQNGMELAVGTCDVSLEGTIIGENIEVAIAVVAKPKDGGEALDVAVDFAGTKLTTDQSSEAQILTFGIQGDKTIGNPVINEDGNIYFYVNKNVTEEDLKALVPEFTISPNATVSPESGTPQDFSEGKTVTYTVVSQDGIYKKEYHVFVKGALTLKYTFDEWGIKEAGNYKYAYLLNTDWDSSNDAVSTIKTLNCYDKEAPYPIVEVEAGHTGYGASITTLDTKGRNMIIQRIPKITAGTLFTGVFKTDAFTPLNSTKFGIPFVAKPASLKGYYKYTPGPDYYQVGSTIDKATIDEAQKDECSIVAVLYEADGDEVLNGATINDPDQVVLRAEMSDGNVVTEWKSFEIPFNAINGFEYDNTKNYKLAIVCSSSKNGATYSGAPGSVLMVDDFEIVLAE